MHSCWVCGSSSAASDRLPMLQWEVPDPTTYRQHSLNSVCLQKQRCQEKWFRDEEETRGEMVRVHYSGDTVVKWEILTQ